MRCCGVNCAGGEETDAGLLALTGVVAFGEGALFGDRTRLGDAAVGPVRLPLVPFAAKAPPSARCVEDERAVTGTAAFGFAGLLALIPFTLARGGANLLGGVFAAKERLAAGLRVRSCAPFSCKRSADLLASALGVLLGLTRRSLLASTYFLGEVALFEDAPPTATFPFMEWAEDAWLVPGVGTRLPCGVNGLCSDLWWWSRKQAASARPPL